MNRLPVFFRSGMSLFLLWMFLFLICRLFFLVFAGNWTDTFLLLEATFRGWQFDAAISAYLISLPYILLALANFIGRVKGQLMLIAKWFLIVVGVVVLFLTTADIPYYMHYGSRLNSAALLWKDNILFAAGMIAGEPKYFLFLIPLIVFITVYYVVIKRIFSGQSKANQSSKTIQISLFIAGAILIVIGMRGRIGEKTTLKTGAAYFSQDPFVNHYTLNPVFNFFYSLAEDLKGGPPLPDLASIDDAVEFTSNALAAGHLPSPVARNIVPDSAERRMNVVLVIMEGMSRFNMGKYNGPANITPVLDSLKKISWWFENFYTQGIHTHNGIFSTLYSYPALLRKHPMNNIPSQQYYSIPQVLHERDYQNIFFVTHDGQFDNVSGFLTGNGFDRVYSQDDFPSDKILSTLGVPDDYLFEFSIPAMNLIYATGKNFLCGFMTGSNHRPLIFPEWAHIDFTSKEEEYRMVEYADWSVGRFLKMASSQPWYDNTIFVFIADHGMSFGHTYDMPLSFHHSPFIIHAPGLGLKSESFDALCGQIDVLPTVMGLMNMRYVNNTFGIDVHKSSRPCIYFTADDKIGCIDKEHYFIHRLNGGETLFKYENLSFDDLLQNNPARADLLRKYAFSMLKTSEEINKKQLFSKQGIE